MAQRFDDLMLRRRDPVEGPENPFEQLLSGAQIESQVTATREQARTAAQAFQKEQKRFSTFDRDEAPEDEPGNNVLNNFIRGTLAKSPERIETFDEYFDKNAPARYMLSDMWRGAFNNVIGREVRSTRDRMFEEFQVDQAARQKQQELESRNQQVALQIAARQEEQKQDIQMRFELARIDSIENAQERADARLEFGLKHGLDVQEFTHKVAEDKAKREERALNFATDSKVPLIAEFRKQVLTESPDLKDHPEEFNSEVMNRYEKALADEANTKIAVAKARSRNSGSGKYNPANTSPARVELMMENVLRGKTSLATARQILVGQNKDPDAFFRMLEMGEGRVIRTDKVRTQLKVATDGIGMARQLKSLALEARKNWQESQTGLLGNKKIDPESESFQGLKANLQGAFQRLDASVGSGAAATVFERLIPGFATTIARAGGETGRISDADVQRFIKQAPSLSDTLEELDILEREIIKTIGRSLLSSIANEAPTLGRRQSSGKPPQDYNKFMRDFMNDVPNPDGEILREMLGTNDPVEAIVLQWEQGRDWKF